MATPSRAKRKPSSVTKRMGLLEKEVMPSMAKATIFFSGYLDSPATRSPRS